MEAVKTHTTFYVIGYDFNNRLDFILCLKCGLKSYHPKDVENCYCVKCDLFHEGW